MSISVLNTFLVLVYTAVFSFISISECSSSEFIELRKQFDCIEKCRSIDLRGIGSRGMDAYFPGNRVVGDKEDWNPDKLMKLTGKGAGDKRSRFFTANSIELLFVNDIFQSEVATSGFTPQWAIANDPSNPTAIIFFSLSCGSVQIWRSSTTAENGKSKWERLDYQHFIPEKCDKFKALYFDVFNND